MSAAVALIRSMGEFNMTLKAAVETVLTLGVALFFFYMGFGAVIDPDSTLSYFSAGTLGADMRNEVRAVYGGYGVAIGLLLLATLKMSSLKTGVRLTVSVSVGGMAAGRFLSMLMEQPAGDFPLLILFVEIALVVMLAAALSLQNPAPRSI
ncbi:MAG: DUF4345 domain-containing protein [Parvibaculaceae bacterium]|nr:DUF4345 domain-containing protein [Parvibaculaceae bacterium]